LVWVLKNAGVGLLILLEEVVETSLYLIVDVALKNKVLLHFYFMHMIELVNLVLLWNWMLGLHPKLV
jgi:bacteriorhodopsin